MVWMSNGFKATGNSSGRGLAPGNTWNTSCFKRLQLFDLAGMDCPRSRIAAGAQSERREYLTLEGSNASDSIKGSATVRNKFSHVCNNCFKRGSMHWTTTGAESDVNGGKRLTIFFQKFVQPASCCTSTSISEDQNLYRSLPAKQFMNSWHSHWQSLTTSTKTQATVAECWQGLLSLISVRTKTLLEWCERGFQMRVLDMGLTCLEDTNFFRIS